MYYYAPVTVGMGPTLTTYYYHEDVLIRLPVPTTISRIVGPSFLCGLSGGDVRARAHVSRTSAHTLTL